MKNILESNAFVFFGATGDLAYKKIFFPALYAMGASERAETFRSSAWHAPAGRSTSSAAAPPPNSIQAAGDFEPEVLREAVGAA